MKKNMYNSDKYTDIGKKMVNQNGKIGLNNPITTTGTATTGTTITTNLNGWGTGSSYNSVNATVGYSNILINKSPEVMYIDFIVKLLDIDIDFEKFKTMSEDDKAIFARKFIIDRIVK